MLLDCCDGEVARWRRTSSPAGVFLDKVGHYTTEALIPLALGVRAAGVASATCRPTTAGRRSERCSRCWSCSSTRRSTTWCTWRGRLSGLTGCPTPRPSGRPTRRGSRRARRVARFVPFHRLYHSVELTLLILRRRGRRRCAGRPRRRPGSCWPCSSRSRSLVAGRSPRGDPGVGPGAHPRERSGADVGVVVLTQGTRPDDLRRGRRLRARPARRRRRRRGGRQRLGADRAARGCARPRRCPRTSGSRPDATPVSRRWPATYVFFLDDDASLPDPGFLAEVARRFAADPDSACCSRGSRRPDGSPTPRRWVPRMRKGDPARVGTGLLGVGGRGRRAPQRPSTRPAAGRRRSSTPTRGSSWPGGCGTRATPSWYAGDLAAEPPGDRADPARLTTTGSTPATGCGSPAATCPRCWCRSTSAAGPESRCCGRSGSRTCCSAWFGGWREGWREDPGPRRPMRWSTVWRMTKLGRPPVV